MRFLFYLILITLSILDFILLGPNNFIISYKSGVIELLVSATLITVEISATLPLYLSGFSLYSFILEQYPNSSVKSFILLNHVSLSSDS